MKHTFEKASITIAHFAFLQSFLPENDIIADKNQQKQLDMAKNAFKIIKSRQRLEHQLRSIFSDCRQFFIYIEDKPGELG